MEILTAPRKILSKVDKGLRIVLGGKIDGAHLILALVAALFPVLLSHRY